MRVRLSLGQTNMNSDLFTTSICSDLLIQKAISKEYAHDIFTEFTSEIALYMGPKPPEKIEETFLFIDQSIEKIKNGTDLQLVIILKNTHEFIGCSGIHRIDSKHPRLGIWIKKNAFGNGYGLEAVKALIQWARNNLCFEYIRYPVDKNNYPSKRIPEILHGKMVREYKAVNRCGEYLDCIEYAVY